MSILRIFFVSLKETYMLISTMYSRYRNAKQQKLLRSVE